MLIPNISELFQNVSKNGVSIYYFQIPTTIEEMIKNMKKYAGKLAEKER